MFRIPSIGTSSIYHDATLISESRIFAMPDSGMERASLTAGTCHAPREKTAPREQQPVSHINAQNRPKVVSHLFAVFSYMLGTLTKECLEWSCRVSSRMIMRSVLCQLNIYIKECPRNMFQCFKNHLRIYIDVFNLGNVKILSSIHFQGF